MYTYNIYVSLSLSISLSLYIYIYISYDIACGHSPTRRVAEYALEAASTDGKLLAQSTSSAEYALVALHLSLR